MKGLAPHVDLWLAETQSSIVEARAIHAGLPQDGKPFWLSFTLKDEDTDEVPRLRSGEPVADAAEAAAQLGVQVLLFNCSQPEVIGAAIDAARQTFERLGVAIQIGAYANAFPPQPKEATANDGLDPLRDDLDPPGYLHWAADWQKRGASHLGGCCGIGPEHIAVLAQKLSVRLNRLAALRQAFELTRTALWLAPTTTPQTLRPPSAIPNPESNTTRYRGSAP